MKIIRTRIVVALASSAVIATGFGLTAVAVSSGAAAATPLASGQTSNAQCPNTTIIDYCSQR